MIELFNRSKKSFQYTACLIVAVLVLLTCCFVSVGKAIAETEPVFSKTEDSIYATLREAGYSHAGACGIMGNIAVENPGYDADLEANHGTTYGLFQWNSVGERRETLVRWCNNRLLYPNRVEGQIAFALYELAGGDYYASLCNDYLLTARDARLAAMEFAVGFERCIGESGNDEADGEYEGSIYPERVGRVYQALNKRMDKAAMYDEGYADVDYEELEPLDIKITPTAGIIAEAEDNLEQEYIIENGLSTEELDTTTLWLYRGLCILIGYCFGCVFISQIFKKTKRRDVSNFKSMNVLFTHMDDMSRKRLRDTAIVILWDIAKTYLAFWIIILITKGALGRDQVLWVGIGVILGNDYPFWNRFKGGMGATVTFVTLWTYMPIWGPICCVAGAILSFITGSLPVGTFIITVLIIPFVFLFRGIRAGIMVVVIMAMMLVKMRKPLKKYAGRKLLHVNDRRRSKGRRKSVDARAE